MEHVILYFIDHTCEHTPWEDLEECKAYVNDQYKNIPQIIPVHYIKVKEDGEDVFFRLGEKGSDDWCVHRIGSYC